MIKHTELRCGNIFWENYGGFKKVSGIVTGKNGIVSIHATGLKHTVQGSFDPEEIYGVSLSEEWLLRADAIVYKFDNGQPNQYRIGERLFVIRDGVITDYGSSLPLKYVHTFQNFMFIMTGEELTFKNLDQ